MKKKDGLVIFAGAGIPTSTGIPAWEGLLKGLAKKLGDKKLEESITSKSDYPQKAQEVYEAFVDKENGDDNKGENEYYSAIREL